MYVNKKRFVYISLCVLLGIIVSIIIHALIEIPVLKFFVNNLTWPQWYVIHYIGSVILLALGVLAGYFIGKRWWRIVYIEKNYKSRYFGKV
ncbi:MAG: hypothetical protein CMI55_03915 [Parcubacteria group bacterium]|jgi:hypothetical protein|nr:hypothetical protein [Parcubacteria group bacterium]|tara:strand:+ start:309 stop:581 length:273 start_codon:yes stop_codon:yes gene_type:complete